MLPLPWLELLSSSVFLEMQVGIWGALIVTGNRIWYLWPSVAAGLLPFALSLTLAHTTPLAAGDFILAPLLAHSPFNCWYWSL
jgi:hypothetical protein